MKAMNKQSKKQKQQPTSVVAEAAIKDKGIIMSRAIGHMEFDWPLRISESDLELLGHWNPSSIKKTTSMYLNQKKSH